METLENPEQFSGAAAAAANGALQIPENIQVICIDEGQFLKGLREFCVYYNKRGIDIYVAALSTDKDQHCWPAVAELYPVCHKIKTLYAVCVCCHDTKATFTRSTAPAESFKNGNLRIGADSEYVAVCLSCLSVEITPGMREQRRERLQLLKSY